MNITKNTHKEIIFFENKAPKNWISGKAFKIFGITLYSTWKVADKEYKWLDEEIDTTGSAQIIATSNYNDETFNEYKVLDTTSLTKKQAEQVLNTMNNDESRPDDVYYVLESILYVPYKFQP